RHAVSDVAAGDGHHQPKVRPHQMVAGFPISLLNPPTQLLLGLGAQKRCFIDLLQIGFHARGTGGRTGQGGHGRYSGVWNKGMISADTGSKFMSNASWINGEKPGIIPGKNRRGASGKDLRGQLTDYLCLRLAPCTTSSGRETASKGKNMH